MNCRPAELHAPHSERGSAAVELPFVLGFLVLPFALLVLQFPRWIERQHAATDVASEIARSHAITNDPVRTGELIERLGASHRLEPASLVLSSTTIGDRGGSLVVEVTVEFPTLSFGPFGTVGTTSWTARHVERVADFGSASQE